MALKFVVFGVCSENMVFTLKLKKSKKKKFCFLFGFQIKENVIARFTL